MKAAARPTRFDVATLRKRAGDKVFARGEEYHRDGLVEILSVERDRVLAQVAGSDDYRTVLKGRGKKIGGECSCPAFRDWGFCKHMVATALVANETADEGRKKEPSVLDRIRAHLKQQGVDALVEMVVELAEGDTVLLRKLDIAAAASAHGDGKSLEKQLRRAIDGATRTRRFVDYDEAEEWADNVSAALDAVAKLADGPHAALAMRLALHAIDRIEDAIESMDDSDGHGDALFEQAGDIHLAACQSANPDPVELARELVPRELYGKFDTFYRAVAGYADVLGEAGLAEYRRLATEAWNELPPPARKRGDVETPVRLVSILDFFAERDGDVEARIALRARDLSSPEAYVRLARFCLEQGRPDEALRHAEEGLWMFEDGSPNSELVLFVVERLAKAGRKDEAAVHLAKMFQKAPSLELYQRIRKVAGKAAGEQAQAYLAAKAAADRTMDGDIASAILIRILTDEKKYDAAWKALHDRPRRGERLAFALAEASEKTHPEEALAVYARQVEYHIGAGSTSGYETACRLIGRMAGLRDVESQKAYVLALKVRHQRKYKFITLLG